jgi:hypothetical protein
MPIMASHHSDSLPHSGYLSPNSNFFNTASPDSTRKRKQELQYPGHTVIQDHNVLDLPYYSQSWRHGQFQQPEPAVHNEANMQSSSDLIETSSWNHESPNNNSFLVMHQHQATFNSSDPQPLQNYYEQETTGLIQSVRHDMGNDGGVGENSSRGLNEIHQMLSLDQFQSEAPSISSVPSFAYNDNNKNMTRPNTMNLTDLGAGNLLEQRQLLQSWSSGNTTNAQNSSYSNNGSTTPVFFSPGFLESLQEDDNESYHTPEFPFHQSNPSKAQDWSHSPPSRKFTSVEHNTIMVKNRCSVLFYICNVGTKEN